MTNLLYKASIVTTPTAYGVGVLNSIKPAIPFGEELIVNGNFSTDSDWAKVNATISSGQATITVTGGGFSGIGQTLIYTSGRKYRLIANIKGASGSSGKQVRFMDNASDTGGLTTSNGVVTLNESVQNIEIIWTANSNSNSIRNDRNTSSGDYSWIVYDISIKEVTDADFDFTRTSSATRVNPDYLIETVSINSANLVQNGNFSELGSEKITNGDFETDTDWTKDTGWSISGGSLNASATTTQAYQLNTGIVTNKTYKVTYTISNYVSGSVRIELGGFNVSVGAPRSANGTYTEYIVALGNDSILFDGITSFTGSIDNVSVKQVDPNDNWTLQNGSIINEGVVTVVANGFLSSSGSNWSLYQTDVFETNTKYKVTFKAKQTSGTGTFLLGAGYSQPFNQVITSEFVNYSLDINEIAVTNHLSIGGETVGDTFEITDISVIEIQENGVPRLDYTNGTASILLENQSTNLITYSQAISNTPVKNGTFVDNAAISPDGTLNATKLTATTTDPFFYQNITFAAATYTSSIYVKGIGDSIGKEFRIAISSSTTAPKLIVPSEWTRFEFTATVGAGTASTGIEITDPAIVGDEVLVWGWQVEQQSYPTSYIPTSGQSGGVTRAAETLNNAGNSDLINSTEGVLYCEISALADDLTNRTIALSDGTTSNTVRIQYLTVSNSIWATITNIGAGGNQAILQYTSSDITINSKVALKYKANDFSLFVNGIKVATDTSGVTFTSNTLNTFQFDRGNGAESFYGRCKTVAVFSEALSDTELACLTSTNNREIFLNYYYRMQYVGANTEALSCAEQTFNI